MREAAPLMATHQRKRTEWREQPEREQSKYLRETYWAELAKGGVHFRPSDPQKLAIIWQAGRNVVQGNRSSPGDYFSVVLSDQNTSGMRWVEVTEVFESPAIAAHVEQYMRALVRGTDGARHERAMLDYITGGIPNAYRQSKMADRVLRQIRKKLSKDTYTALRNRMGPGTLVVGLPLWNTVKEPDSSAKYVSVRDFYARLQAGLMDLRDSELLGPASSFDRVEVRWIPNQHHLSTFFENRVPRWYDLNPLLDIPVADHVLTASSTNLSLSIQRPRRRTWSKFFARPLFALLAALLFAVYRSVSWVSAFFRTHTAASGLPSDRQRLARLLAATGWRRDNLSTMALRIKSPFTSFYFLKVYTKACCFRWRYRRRGWVRRVARLSMSRRLQRYHSVHSADC